MWTHYAKIALRHLLKDKRYSFIILFGLSLGITCCLLITLFVKHEISYEDFHVQAKRIARVCMDYSIGGEGNKGDATSTYVGPSLQKNFPEVESFVRLAYSPRIVKNGENLFVEQHFIYADSNFFSVFSYPLLSGDSKTALCGPYKLVISRSMAIKYFGNDQVIGKVIKISSRGDDYTITGVAADCPKNTHLQFDFIGSFATFGNDVLNQRTYWNANYTTYLLLKSETGFTSLEPKIKPFMKKEMGNDLNDSNSYVTYFLEPIQKIHLYSPYQNDGQAGSITYVYVVCAVAFLILLIACFTYINLSTAKSTERAKEIGVRKTAGAYRSQIFMQFICEAFWLVSLAFIVSIALTYFTLPLFNHLVNRSLEWKDLLSANIMLTLVSLLLVVSLFSGLYPAYLLASLNPVLVLKGQYKHSGKGLFLRKCVFFVQFVISVFLIITALVIQQQLHYFQTKELGYDKENVVILPLDGKILAQIDAFKQEIKSKTGALFVGKSDFTPNHIFSGYSMQKPDMGDSEGFGVNAAVIDEEYLDASGIKLIAGRNITQKDMDAADQETDSLRYYYFILNESAVKQMGWTAEGAIGKKMSLDPTRPGEVKGVVKNFHTASLRQAIKPLVLFPGKYGQYLLVKLPAGQTRESIIKIETLWKKMFTHRPFDFSFLEDKYNALYDKETRMSKALNVFTIVAIFLALFGLFGLSAYEVNQRSKEISIRKIVGNPVSAIVANLSAPFLKLILFSCCLAIPLTWIVCSRWLEEFTFRIQLEWWYFVLPCMALILVAFITISIKVVGAAKSNPVKYLRME